MFGAKAKKCADLEQQVNDTIAAMKRRLFDPTLSPEEREFIAAKLKEYERDVRVSAEKALLVRKQGSIWA